MAQDPSSEWGLRNGDALTRRALMRLGASGLILGLGTTALEQLLAGPAAADSRVRRASVAHRNAASAPPAWTRRWHHSINSIDDFHRRSPHTTFPHRAIMLTIDDGPSREWTPKYLRLLAQHHVRATFCMIGKQVHPLRHIVKDVAEHGHAIANHTWSHDERLAHGSRAHIHSEIARTSAAIHHAAGTYPTQFRAPGGAWGQSIFAELARDHMMPLGWNIDPRDWARPGTRAIETAMLRARTHDIILCHDGGGNRAQTYHALTKVIPALLHRGYTFVTLPHPKAR